ncbi:MAG: hypothetical protein CVU84_15340 [Firmicutes bacterium HGW-Firmicutes-1]|nr:MAG: hypothetical protein CVU84_15340 [Firmicutes bacterium HGW-Firmicutes-1]
MKRTKGLLTIGLSVILAAVIILPTFGENQIIDLSNIQEYITKNNIEIKRYDEKIKIAQNKYNNTVFNVGEAGTDSIDTQKKKTFYPKQEEMNLAYSKWERSEKEQELQVEGKDKYFNLLLIDEEITLQVKKIERIKLALEQLKKRMDLGLEVASSVTKKENEILNEEHVLKGLQTEKEKITMDLNIVINYAMTSKNTLKVIDIPFEVYKVDDLKSKIDKVLTWNGEIIKLDAEVILANLHGTIYSQYGNTDQHNELSSRYSEESADKKLDLLDEKISIEYKIRSQYNTLLNAQDKVTIDELKAKNLKTDLDAAKKRSDLGLITSAEVAIAEENVAFAELALKKSKLDYYLKVEVFKNLLQ